MDLKLNLQQLTNEELQQVTGGVAGSGVGICRCHKAPGEFAGNDEKYVPMK